MPQRNTFAWSSFRRGASKPSGNSRRPRESLPRRFDAVVVEAVASQVKLWEPNHGEVLAQARDPGRSPLPGSRAYLSSGLEGAEWWMAGPAVARAGDADVELSEVQAFLSMHGLWDNQI